MLWPEVRLAAERVQTPHLCPALHLESFLSPKIVLYETPSWLSQGGMGSDSKLCSAPPPQLQGGVWLGWVSSKFHARDHISWALGGEAKALYYCLLQVLHCIKRLTSLLRLIQSLPQKWWGSSFPTSKPGKNLHYLHAGFSHCYPDQKSYHCFSGCLHLCC